MTSRMYKTFHSKGPFTLQLQIPIAEEHHAEMIYSKNCNQLENILQFVCKTILFIHFDGRFFLLTETATRVNCPTVAIIPRQFQNFQSLFC